jgi:hypothetical protein
MRETTSSQWTCGGPAQGLCASAADIERLADQGLLPGQSLGGPGNNRVASPVAGQGEILILPWTDEHGVFHPGHVVQVAIPGQPEPLQGRERPQTHREASNVSRARVFGTAITPEPKD